MMMATLLTKSPDPEQEPVSRRPATSVAMGCASALALAALSCSDPTPASVVRVLDRPSAVTFGCIGNLRLTQGGLADVSQPLVPSAMPLSACRAWATSERPPGQEALEASLDNPTRPFLYSFFLLSAQGSVAVARFTGETATAPTILDSDRFSPGDNTIPFGSLPVGLTTDTSGCHLLATNSGTCDLSTMDVASAVDPEIRPEVRRTAVVNSHGEPIAARPTAMAADPRSGLVGIECPARPEGLLYISYPDCNLVAAVDAGSGEIIAGILFHEDGSVEITDGNVSCGGTCGSVAALQEGAPRPSALEINAEQQRLYVGLENRSELLMVELSDDFLPASIRGVPLEGDVGITELAVTDELFDNLGTPMRFAYAIATDGTVRVVEVADLETECDTQSDTRYLHTETDTSFLACMPVGDPRTPPRRYGARSPGIHAPDAGTPLDVAFVYADNTGGDINSPPGARLLKGHFAYITSSAGRIFIVNVNDERYPDIEPALPPDEDPTFNPTQVDIALALPHRPRDFGTARSLDFEYLDHDQDENTPNIRDTSCSFDVIANIQATMLPRMPADITRAVSPDVFSGEKGHILPNMRRVICTDYQVDGDSGEVSEVYTAVPELSHMANVYEREIAFPDFPSVPISQDWAFIWEGPVSLDSASSSIDGPPIRQGGLSIGADFELIDATEPFCRMGLEPFDIIALAGCNPSRGDADCSIGETCFVHPRSPSNVSTGMCLPSGRETELSGTCEGILTSLRRFTVTETHSGRLALAERRRAVRTSPIAGCTVAEESQECVDYYRIEQSFADPTSPAEQTDEIEVPYTFACEVDTSRKPGPPRCLMTCQESADCEDGYACSDDGYCVAGQVPPVECVAGLQRYQARVGEAFAVIGSRDGFLHHRIADAATGECIDDPAGNPLAAGRIPLDVPQCTSDDIDDITPNPCATVVTHNEVALQYDVIDGECVPRENDELAVLDERQAAAIRFRNPSFTTHFVDLVPVLDQSCNRDRLGGLADYRVVFPDYRMTFQIFGGYLPSTSDLALALDTTSRFLTYPAAITLGPWGRFWILDQGDRSASIRSQVVWLSPTFLTDSDISIPNFYLR